MELSAALRESSSAAGWTSLGFAMQQPQRAATDVHAAESAAAGDVPLSDAEAAFVNALFVAQCDSCEGATAASGVQHVPLEEEAGKRCPGDASKGSALQGAVEACHAHLGGRARLESLSASSGGSLCGELERRQPLDARRLPPTGVEAHAPFPAALGAGVHTPWELPSASRALPALRERPACGQATQQPPPRAASASPYESPASSPLMSSPPTRHSIASVAACAAILAASHGASVAGLRAGDLVAELRPTRVAVNATDGSGNAANVPIYRCPCCSYGSPSRTSLERHLRVHTGEKPFACDECGRRFRQSSALSQHRLIHENRFPYSCAFAARGCTLRFRHRHRAKTHEKSCTHGKQSAQQPQPYSSPPAGPLPPQQAMGREPQQSPSAPPASTAPSLVWPTRAVPQNSFLLRFANAPFQELAQQQQQQPPPQQRPPQLGVQFLLLALAPAPPRAR